MKILTGKLMFVNPIVAKCDVFVAVYFQAALFPYPTTYLSQKCYERGDGCQRVEKQQTMKPNASTDLEEVGHPARCVGCGNGDSH